MQSKHFLRAAILASTLIIGFVAYWEYYWRSKGFTIAYNDDKMLWATHRRTVYKPIDQSTIFIGSSRIRFGLDIAAWEALTGDDAIQLALGGNPPRLVLHDLALDENFKGKLIIDVMEPLFFSNNMGANEKSAREAVEYYYSETPAQRVNAFIDYLLQSKLVLLEEGTFGLNALLNTPELPNRSGVVVRRSFPKEFRMSTFDRQAYLTPMFLADSTLRKRKISISLSSPSFYAPGIKGSKLDSFLKEIKASIDKIKSRGGRVLFVRPPSSNLYIETETRIFPRQEYWDRLLTYTNIPGIHFSDYPETANLTCPDWTHLSPKDATTYTRQLVKILKQQHGWTFPKSD